jgi:L-ribulose-5-phosphate 3-epimerase
MASNISVAVRMVGIASRGISRPGVSLAFLLTVAMVWNGVSSLQSADGENSGPKTNAPMSKLVCRLANYQQYSEAAWTNLPSIGVKHVFINTPSPDQVDEMLKKLADHGLDAVVMRGEADLTVPEGLDPLAVQLRTCQRMGVHYLFLSVKRRDVDKNTIYGRLRQAGEIARKYDVTLVLETHPDLGTNGDVQLETMKNVNHPNVRINFDTGNIHYYNRGTDAPTELRKIIDYVATVEIKDHNGEFESWHFPALGQGIVKIPEVLQILREHGFTGPVTMEIEGIKGVTRNQAEVLRDIAQSTAYLRSLASFR